nr:structural protein [Streptococcus oralis]
DIYVYAKPIQQYQLTDNRCFGKLIKQDFNTMTATGHLWMDGSSPNNPLSGACGMLEVFRPNPGSVEAIQRFTTSMG